VYSDRWNATVVRVCAYIGNDPLAEPVTVFLQKMWSFTHSELITIYTESVQIYRENSFECVAEESSNWTLGN
jgi:hypothetical protein